MKLKRPPKPLARFLLRVRTHQKVQRFGMIRKQVRRDVRADIAGGPGQEDSHDLCQETAVDAELAASAALGSERSASCTERRGRGSSGRPSMRG